MGFEDLKPKALRGLRSGPDARKPMSGVTIAGRTVVLFGTLRCNQQLVALPRVLWRALPRRFNPYLALLTVHPPGGRDRGLAQT